MLNSLGGGVTGKGGEEWEAKITSSNGIKIIYSFKKLTQVTTSRIIKIEY